ncbi:unnamed protein product [Urochloa decumbens]|uniref:Uncharacterized protein n=1 Tax=Urochloa decumbens TaxID=240449 RepID=A0ABC9F1P8_9POAL
MSISVSVRKSSPAIIRPPEPPVTTSGASIKLTSLDWVFVHVPVTALLVFEHPPCHDAAETIKRALSQALSHYSPFAGRISDAGGDGLTIRCSGEGVQFVAASADCGLQEAKIFEELTGGGVKALLDELAVTYPPGSYNSGGGGGDDPLLSVQVTDFSCGGLVLGVTWGHAVADGVGMAQLLAAVGELARGSPSPSVAPARWDGAVSGLAPLFDPVPHAIMACPGPSPDMELIVPLDVTVPSALISRVKAESSSSSRSSNNSSFFSGGPCTAFEAVLAVLWRCRVRATMSDDPGTPVYLSFAADIRRHVGAKDGYYGNCGVNQLLAGAATTSGAVASAGLAELAGMIRRAKDQLPETVWGGGGGETMRGLRGRYDVLHVSSWRNLGFERVDLGSGAPARVMTHWPGGTPSVPICMVYPPCKGKDGVNVLSISMRQEHADAFLNELANLCRA